MVALREIIAEYDVRFDPRRQIERGNRNVNQLTSRLQGLDRVVGGVRRTLGGFATQLAGAVGAAGLFQFVNGVRESSVELQRNAARLGINARQLRGWQAQAIAAGAETDNLVDAMNDLQLRAQDAVTDGGEVAEMFGNIGISVDDLRPHVNDAASVFEFFQRRLREVNDEGMRRFIVDELMSDAGVALIPMFERQASALNLARAQTEESSDSVIELGRRSMQLNRIMAGAALRFEEFRATVALRFMPIIERVIRIGGELSQTVQNWIGETRNFESLLQAVGIVAVAVAAATITAWGPVAAAFVGAVGAVALLTRALNELKETQKGGDTATRRFIDGMLGVGATHRFIRDLTIGWRFLALVIDAATQGLGRFANRLISIQKQLLPIASTMGAIRDFFTAERGRPSGISGLLGGVGLGGLPDEIVGRVGSIAASAAAGRQVTVRRQTNAGQPVMVVNQNNQSTFSGFTTRELEQVVDRKNAQNNDRLARALQNAATTDQGVTAQFSGAAR